MTTKIKSPPVPQIATRYRIYAEFKQELYPATMNLVNRYFAETGFTVYQTQGYWMGKPEPSLVIEIIGGEAADEWMIEELAQEIKELAFQEAVMITADTVNVSVV
jgi:hypothetical protein